MIFLCPSTLTENVHKQFECNFVISHSKLNWPITFGNSKMAKMHILEKKTLGDSLQHIFSLFNTKNSLIISEWNSQFSFSVT